MEKMVTFGCGHTKSVRLIGASQANKETLRLLVHSSCPTCQRRSRYAAASQCARVAGLLPLRAGSLRHLALAEIVRATLWRVLVASCTGEQSSHLLAALFNQHTQASFWLALRGWTLFRLTPEQRVSLLLRLLPGIEKDEPDD